MAIAAYYSDYRAIADRVVSDVQDAAAHKVVDRKAANAAVRGALLEVELLVLARWTHWKDGVEYVGSCGITLKEAKQLACENAAENQP